MSYEPTTWVTGDIITATKLNNIESGVQSVSSSYTPTTWVTGDIITAVKLNNIEQGIANAGGGSSDFSTAEVTFVNNAEYIITNYITCQQFDSGDFTEKITAFVLDDEIGVNSYPEVAIDEGNTTLSFYLINGCNFGIGFANANNVNVSGSCELVTYSDLPTAIITGDCTITIS